MALDYTEKSGAEGYQLLLTDFDLQLISEGTHYRTYEKLGAHLREVNGIKGVHFAVWAPNAARVNVVGNFNNWEGSQHQMYKHPEQGIWELFIPGLTEYELYKYEIFSLHNNYVVSKTDPYAFAGELRPRTASVVANLEKYKWNDGEWLKDRIKRNNIKAPVAVYELHAGSWQRDENGNWLTYQELAHRLVAYVKELGYTHIELMPISEHPYDGSWGYQTTGYYAVTSRYGTPEDFMYFVDHCHQNGIGVILDWVPAHFPTDQHGLGYFDGTHLYEHADPRQGFHQDWGTFIFNYGRNEVRNFLLSNALFWLDKYHIDGLRVDAVASMLYLDYSRNNGEWVPNQYGGRENLDAIEFLKQLNIQVHAEYPDTLTLAEESTAWPMVSRPVYVGGLGFDLKWNMGWMHDMLDYMGLDPIYRRYQHNKLTFSLMYAFSEHFILPFSHDEVVHLKGSMINKMPGDVWQKFANLRTLYGYMYTHPGKKMLFMGDEFGQWKEWDYNSQLEWNLLDYPSHKGLQQYVTDLNRLYQTEPALHEVDDSWEGFRWIDFYDTEQSVLVFSRHARESQDFVVVVINFTPVPRYDYRIGVPEAGFYEEILNSDAASYWGSNVGNMGGKASDPLPWSSLENSLSITLPPLSTLIFKLKPETTGQNQAIDENPGESNK
jgi:1,4-alpha-glucan branching enzyme